MENEMETTLMGYIRVENICEQEGCARLNQQTVTLK